MHAIYMKRVFFLFITTFLLLMCVKDFNDHVLSKQKDCVKQQNIVFLKTHKVMNECIPNTLSSNQVSCFNYSVPAALYKIFFCVMGKNMI